MQNKLNFKTRELLTKIQRAEGVSLAELSPGDQQRVVILAKRGLVGKYSGTWSGKPYSKAVDTRKLR